MEKSYYIKGYYGYKNFGDEMLIFGLLNYLEKNVEVFEEKTNKKIDKRYYLEVENVQRMQSRMKTNASLLDFPLENIVFVPIQQHRHKVITHLKTFFGRSPYRKMTKIFGGGELFDAKKSFPHNGRNILILFFYSVLKKNFFLFGGIGEAKTFGQKILHKILFPRAKKIVCRDETSYQRAKTQLCKKNKAQHVLLYHDFSLDVFPKVLQITPSNKKILLNCGYSPFVEQQLSKYAKYAKYAKQIKQYITFFSCEYLEDQKYYQSLKKNIPHLQMYDRKKYSLLDTLKMFAHAKYGIGTRLHFCIPLKYYKIPFDVVSGQDKHKKLL